MRKSMQLKAVAFAAAAALMGVSGMASASEAAQTAPSTFKPGTYTAQVNGHNAPLTVQVTVGKNRIEKIDYSKNLETIGVGRVALDIVSKKILDHQSVGVDAVTGATISSFALMQGVKDCLKQAGGDMTSIRLMWSSWAAAEPVLRQPSRPIRPVPSTFSSLRNWVLWAARPM